MIKMFLIDVFSLDTMQHWFSSMGIIQNDHPWMIEICGNDYAQIASGAAITNILNHILASHRTGKMHGDVGSFDYPERVVFVKWRFITEDTPKVLPFYQGVSMERFQAILEMTKLMELEE